MEIKKVFAGGCNIPFGEPWPSNIPPFSVLNKTVTAKPFIVGLGHKAQQGKDTLAAHLIEKLGPRPEGTFGPYFPIDIRRYAFADELKVEVFDWLQGAAFGMSEIGNFVSETVWENGVHKGTKKHYGETRNGDLPYPRPFPDKLYSREEKLKWIEQNKIILRPLLQKWGTEFRRAQDPDYWVKKTFSFIQEEKPQGAVITDMRFLNETEICDVQINVVRPSSTPIFGDHQSETELDTFPYPYIVVGESVEDLKKKGFDLVEGLLQERGLLPREQHQRRVERQKGSGVSSTSDPLYFLEFK